MFEYFEQALTMLARKIEKPGERDTELSYMIKSMCGALGEIRTPDLLIRSQTLYPAELQAQKHGRPYILNGIHYSQ